MNKHNHVILVHGLWYGTGSMQFLARRLKASGFITHLFEYSATAETLERNASRLSEYCHAISVPTVHVVGHSYGGLVILRMMTDHPDGPFGRTVLLGTPVQGCQSVHRALNLPGSKRLFGKAAMSLCRGVPDMNVKTELAMLAGCKPLGLGRLFGLGGRDGDGTVELEETRLPGPGPRLVLPVSHSGMVYSARVAAQVAQYLKNGAFA